jgi:hypothetical protein
MNRPTADQSPDRLLASDATDFERRVLEAALQKKPSSAASSRMAKALGIAMTVGTTTTATTVAAGATVTKVAATAGATAAWPWVTVGVLGLVVGGAVIGTRATREARPPQVSPPAITVPAPPPAPPATELAKPALPAEPPARVAASPRVRAATTTSELREQVALLDSARQAMSRGESRRTLEILRRYLDKYPSGTFRPEATAIKIEALMKVGREAEARALAERFVTENRGSLLAKRVADVAGLTER